MSSPTETLAPVVMYSLPELTTLLIKDQGIHEGLFEISVEFSIAVGAVGPSKDSAMPGAVIGTKRIGLRKVDSPNPLSIDAASVNPAPKSRRRASKN